MHTRLLPLLIVLMAAVLLALGVPLAVSVAGAEQQDVVVDRIDDTARFAALAQFVTEPADTSGGDINERRETLGAELRSYHEVYGIRAGVFYRNDAPMAHAPDDVKRHAGDVLRSSKSDGGGVAEVLQRWM